MISLERYQRGLLDLLKNRGNAPADRYLVEVANSPGILVVREIAIWWRAFQIGSECPLVSRILKHQGLFEATISDYFGKNRTSPFVEELTENFLTFLAGSRDPFLSSFARFERALLRARARSEDTFEIQFDRNPDLAFEALERGDPIPLADPEFRYRMTVAHHLPGMFRCSRERIEEADSRRC